jgi:hypothetical protein
MGCVAASRSHDVAHRSGKRDLAGSQHIGSIAGKAASGQRRKLGPGERSIAQTIAECDAQCCDGAAPIRPVLETLES